MYGLVFWGDSWLLLLVFDFYSKGYNESLFVFFALILGCSECFFCLLLFFKGIFWGDGVLVFALFTY